ncbi:hypothetical protein ACFFRR_010357 [Megaselia abdita]
MHFWIDKRSQFGRSRVSASLCNHGMGMSHYPPNRRNKTSSTGTQVHRLPQQSHHGEGRSSNYYHVNANSSYALNSHNLNNNNNIPTSSSAVINSSNNGGNSSTNHNHNNNNGNTIGGSNLVRNSRPHRETIHHQNNNGYNAIRNFQHHPQFGMNANFARQHHRLHHYGGNDNANSSGNSTTINTDNGHLSSNHQSSFRSFQQQQQQHHHQHPHSNNLNCNGNRSNQILDYSNNSANQIDCHRVQNNYVDQHNVHFSASNYNNSNPHMLENRDNQIVPFPWKKGMWASVLLIAFLVAGTKIYFDHRTTNMEILIFCAFASTFALAACTVTICRFPKNTPVNNNMRSLPQAQTRNPITTNSTSTSTTINDLHLSTQHHHQHYSHQVQQQQHQQLSHSLPTSSAPPPYHIAILLPEENKDLPQDESPPPSYDKILI